MQAKKKKKKKKKRKKEKKKKKYVVHSISFQIFLYGHLKLSQTLENSVCYCYTSYEMTDQFYDFRFKWTATAAIGIHPDCHSWWISKMQSDTLEEWYAIKFCFKVGKNATETYGMLQSAFWPSCMNRASVFEWHKRFKESTESVKDDERCWRSKEINTPELIGQRVRVTMMRF